MEHPLAESKRPAPSGPLPGREIQRLRQNLAATPELEETSELLLLAAQPTRLRLLRLLHERPDSTPSDLAARLGVRAAGLSQHLMALRLRGLVAVRAKAQWRYYRLTDHPFNEKLRRIIA